MHNGQTKNNKQETNLSNKNKKQVNTHTFIYTYMHTMHKEHHNNNNNNNKTNHTQQQQQQQQQKQQQR